MGRLARTLLIVLGVIALIGVIGYINRTAIIWNVAMPLMMAPDGDFDPVALNPVDYSEEERWASLPWREDDLSDQIPGGLSTPRADVAVFFVHPTSGMQGENWNLTFEEEYDNGLTHGFLLPGQTSAFTACCDVYAPYYRQALFFSFMHEAGDNGLLAVDAAYRDVVDAFEQFLLWTEDRPFILAGHSQGSAHVIRLIQEEIQGTALEDRMVAAYAPGFKAPEGLAIDACASDTQTGCLLSWNIFTRGTRVAGALERLPVWTGAAYNRETTGPWI